MSPAVSFSKDQVHSKENGNLPIPTNQLCIKFVYYPKIICRALYSHVDPHLLSLTEPNEIFSNYSYHTVQYYDRSNHVRTRTNYTDTIRF